MKRRSNAAGFKILSVLVLAFVMVPAATALAEISYDREISTTGQTLNGDINDKVLITPTGEATDGGAEVKIHGGGLVTVQGEWDFAGQNNFLGGFGTEGTLNIDGGTAVTSHALIFNGCVHEGVEGASKINISAGTFRFHNAYANQPYTRVYVNQTGGFMDGGGTFAVGHGGTEKNGVQAEYLISGGQLKVSDLRVGNRGANLTSANRGSGLFEINGLWTVSGVTKTIEVVNVLTLFDTLAFNFAAGGVTAIDAGSLVLGTTTAAAPTIKLGFLDGLTADDIGEGTYDLIRLSNAWTGSLDDIAFDAPTGWTLKMNGDNTALQAVVPEPSTMALLSLGGIMVLSRRRRK